MRNVGWMTALVLLAGGCDGADKFAPEASGTASAVAAPSVGSPTEVPPAPVIVAAGRAEKENNDLFAFSYSYPNAVGAIPGLKAILDQRLDEAKAELVSSARNDKAEAENSDYPYRAHERQADWKVVTEVPGWLSLSATLYEFMGGAHGMTNFDTLLWDRNAATSRMPIDLFTGKEALRTALQAPFCDALDKERSKRRGGDPVRRSSDDTFSECIDPTSQTLILGSTDRQAFDRIGVLVAPYEAGPYAEGSYEITLPVTARVLAALKPQYRKSFAARP